MISLDATLTVTGGLALLCFCGIGISLYFISPNEPHRLRYAFYLSPTVGLITVGFCLNFLWNVAEIQISKLDLPLLVCLLTVNIGLLVFYFWKERINYQDFLPWKSMLLIVLIFSLVTGLLLLPSAVGTVKYHYWSSSARDAINYTIMSWEAQHHSPDEVRTPSDDKDVFTIVYPGMPLPEEWGRPVITYIMAWLSSIWNIEVYEFYHYFKLLLLLITFFCSLALAQKLSLSLFYSLTCAIICSIGFWPFYLFDSDALSQLSALPIGLLSLFAFVQYENLASAKPLSLEQFFLGLSIGAYTLFYPEFILFMLIGFGLYYTLHFLDHPSIGSICPIRDHIVTGLISLLPQLWTIRYTIQYMWNQRLPVVGVDAVFFQKAWTLHFYPWLYNRYFPINLTGLHFYRINTEKLLSPAFHGIALFLLLMLSLLLLGILLNGIIRTLVGRTNLIESRVITASVVSFWGPAVMLYLLNRDWLSGKVFVGGYSFVIIAILFYTRRLFEEERASSSARRFMRLAIINLTLVFWTISQLGIPFIRLNAIAHNNKLDEYPPLVGEPTTTDILPIIDYIDRTSPNMVAIDFLFYSPWVAHSWFLLLSEHTSLLPLHALGVYADDTPLDPPSKWPLTNPEWWSKVDETPSLFVIAANRDYLAATGLGKQVAGKKDVIVLYSMVPEDFDQLLNAGDILNPAPQQPLVSNMDIPFVDASRKYVRWIQNGSIIRFLASGRENFELYLEYSPNYTGQFVISLNGYPIAQETTLADNTYRFTGCLDLKAGINTLSFEMLGDIISSAKVLVRDFQLSSSTNKISMDLGTAVDTGFIRDGWYQQEEWQGDEFRWAKQEASLGFVTCPTFSVPEYTLSFRAYNMIPDQKVTIKVNGVQVDSVALGYQWNTYSLTVPSSAIKNSEEQIVIELSHEIAPDLVESDPRQMAAAYDWFILEKQ